MFVRKLTSAAMGLTLSLLVAAPLGAADKKADEKKAEMEAMMAKAQEAGAPSAGHEVLKTLAGEWTVTSRAWMPGEKKPQQSSGTSTLAWILGGRFLRQDFKGNWGGQAFEGLGFIGYDNVKKEYVSTWMDSASTGIAEAAGQYDAATKTIKDQGSFSCPITGEKDRAFRAEWKIVDANNFVYNMYAKGPDGKETQTMELKYRRSK